MKIILSILLFLAAGVAIAQEFRYPTLRASGRTLNDFVPQGWRMIDSAFGDLNRDARPDAAFVMESNDTVLERRNFDPSDSSLDQKKARILVILFRDPHSRNYQLAEQNNTFIMRSDEGVNFDPFDDMEIRNEVLNLHFYWGAWTRCSAHYQFRYQQGQFKFIGADITVYNCAEGGGEMEIWSYNFLTSRMKLTTGNMFDETVKERIRWRNLRVRTLRTFKTLPTPFDWEILKDIYL